MKTQEKTDCWRPQYPPAKDARVVLKDSELQTFISDSKPGITIVDYPLEKPACFWIDYEHVYLRANWSTWCTVSLSSPEQVSAICNMHTCQLFSSLNNNIISLTAPVYRIAELPKELIHDDNSKKKRLYGFLRNEEEYNEYYARIEHIVEETFNNSLSVFSKVEFGDDIAPVVISDDNHCLILELLPDDKEFFFLPGEVESISTDDGDDEVSLEIFERLRKMRNNLAEQEPDAVIDMGILCNSSTKNNLEISMILGEVSDIKAFSYNDLGTELEELFLQRDDEEDDDDDEEEEESIADRVKQIIIEHMGVEPSKVQEDMLIVEDLGADDLDFVELTMAFEEAFGCQFPDNAMASILTVGDAIEFIEKHLE